jgi:ankyrin repeat protein
VKLLLSNGADPNETSLEGWTPLFWAVFTQPALSTQYRTRKLRLFAGNAVSITPPSNEAQVGEIVRLLAQHGADVNHPDDEGRTALTYVRSPRVAKALIDAGARTDCLDNENRSVEDWLKRNRVRLASRLPVGGAKP